MGKSSVLLKYELIWQQITGVFEELWQQVVDVILSVNFGFGLMTKGVTELRYLLFSLKLGVCAAKMA